MAIKRPDIYEHNNPDNAFVDGNFVRGGFRTAVADLATLYALSTKIDQLKEHSTVIFVTAAGLYYELVDINNVNNSGGWQPFMTTSALITGATNGLSLVNKSAILGGTLTGSTTINLNSNAFKLESDSTNKYGLVNFCLNSTYANSKFGVCSRDVSSGSWGLSGNSTSITSHHSSNSSNSNCFVISNTGITLTNKTSSIVKSVCLSANALVYATNYCNDYVNRTLVDKEYVDLKVSGHSNILNVCNVGITYTTTCSDDFIGVSGTSCIYLYDAPKIGQRVMIVDICGNAQLDPINVDGNGICINDGGVSSINTDFGSITYVFNGYCWSAVGFVN